MKKIGIFWCMWMDKVFVTEFLVGEEHQQGRRGYTFPFTLYAAPEVQRFVYENGMGYFCHKGFGMLDVAGNDSIKREQQRDAIYA